MSDKPYLIYLHGVGEGDLDQKWKQGLLEGLDKVGYPGLDDVEIIAPHYAHGLRGADDHYEMPPVTIQTPKGERARARREFESRTAAMETRLARYSAGKANVFAGTVVDVALAIPKFKQAQNYLRNENIRAQVLTKILGSIPSSGRALIVAHSLGTVIAADLIWRLPVDLDIVGVVTVGSPLASSLFEAGKLFKHSDEPPKNVGWWVNYWSSTDPVSARRGVSSVFPWLLDVHVRTPVAPASAHAVKEYLSQQLVAEAIGFGLFGSRSTELVRADTSLDVRLDTFEYIALQGLRYAHLIYAGVPGEDKARYGLALRAVQARVVSDLKRKAELESRPLSSTIAMLDFDSADHHSPTPVPGPAQHEELEEVLTRLVALVDQNLLHPFEISVKRELRIRALQDLTAEMGLGSKVGGDVFAALGTASNALPGRAKTNWIKWGALGVGFAVLVVGTAGLALAPAAGVGGAAAVTSALASFGPGGMIGGLLTAGSLVSAGASGIAVGVMSPANSAESVEAMVRSQLAALILRKLYGFSGDDDIWNTWVESEVFLTREVNRLDEISDKDAPGLAELRRKLEAIKAAIRYALENGMAPGGLDDPAQGGGPKFTFTKRAK